MSNIVTPATIDAAPPAARPLLQAVEKQLGSVPNLFRVVSHSPAALVRPCAGPATSCPTGGPRGRRRR